MEASSPGVSARIPLTSPIDLEATLDGGQAFRWWRDGDGFRGVIGRRPYHLSADPGAPHGDAGPAVLVRSVDGRPIQAGDIATLTRYLALDHDFASFVRRYSGDSFIGSALTGWPGLRVLRQDRWECLVAFICSSTSNIPRIKLNVNSLALTYGERVGPGRYDYTFPPAARLAEAGEMPLRSLGLGFRAAYVARAAEAVVAGALDLEAVAAMPYPQALASLTALYGVGEKVADCALAFAFDKPEAFPVDRWIRRALEEWYGLPHAVPVTRSAEWARARFGKDAAYVNQYLFHRQRLTARARASEVGSRGARGSSGASSQAS